MDMDVNTIECRKISELMELRHKALYKLYVSLDELVNKMKVKNDTAAADELIRLGAVLSELEDTLKKLDVMSKALDKTMSVYETAEESIVEDFDEADEQGRRKSFSGGIQYRSSSIDGLFA